MFLQKYIGYKIVVELKENYPYKETGDLLKWLRGSTYINTDLLAVDTIGIWVDWTYERTIIADENAKEIVEPYEEEILHYFLIKWEFIESVIAIDNPKKNQKRIYGSEKKTEEPEIVENELEIATSTEIEVNSVNSNSTKSEEISTIEKIKSSFLFSSKKKEFNNEINRVLENHPNSVVYLKNFYKNNSHLDHELLKELCNKVIDELKVTSKGYGINNEDMEIYVKKQVAKVIQK